MAELFKTEFIVFDVETTGLSSRWGDRIVEIAALKVQNMKVVDKFHSLVNPEREISFGAYQVNGITQSMVADAPKAVEILPDFLIFIGNGCLVGHNVKFDLGFLAQELALAGQLFENRIALDTVRMARGLIPGIGSYSLSSLIYHFGIEESQQHRAMSDVELTFQVFCQLVNMAQRKDMDNIESMVKMFGCRIGRAKK